jgi:dTDP-4-amino-4,6-dideoxygalactose transaminase
VPVVNKRTWTADGGPWRWAKRSPDYSPQACPRTLDLLGRAVHLNISPLLTNDDIEETIDGLRKVFKALA